MRADARRRRQNIVAQARRLFAERGGDIALETVAAESGVGIATLYRNFPAREALIIAVVEDIVEQISASVAAARAVIDGDPAAAWQHLVDALVGMDLGALTDALGAVAESGVGPQVLQVQQRALDSMEALLDALREHGVVREHLTAQEVIVALATITRPQSESIRAAAPNVPRYLVDAFLVWSGVHAPVRRSQATAKSPRGLR